MFKFEPIASGAFGFLIKLHSGFLPLPLKRKEIMQFGYKPLRSIWQKGSRDEVASLITASTATVTNDRTRESATVHLRIEGADNTIYENDMTTAGHDVTVPSAPGQSCPAGKSGNKWFPAATGALDDAACEQGFDWDGNYQKQFNDIFITRIADVEQDDNKFWGILLNYQYTKVGGCQQRIADNDDVLFAFDAFNKQYFLKLTGPTTTTAGVPIAVTVVDGTTNVPMPDVAVGERLTDAMGHATIVFRSPGSYELKAERADSIRSNKLCINVLR